MIHAPFMQSVHGIRRREACCIPEHALTCANVVRAACHILEHTVKQTYGVDQPSLATSLAVQDSAAKTPPMQQWASDLIADLRAAMYTVVCPPQLSQLADSFC